MLIEDQEEFDEKEIGPESESREKRFQTLNPQSGIFEINLKEEPYFAEKQESDSTDNPEEEGDEFVHDLSRSNS